VVEDGGTTKSLFQHLGKGRQKAVQEQGQTQGQGQGPLDVSSLLTIKRDYSEEQLQAFAVAEAAQRAAETEVRKREEERGRGAVGKLLQGMSSVSGMFGFGSKKPTEGAEAGANSGIQDRGVGVKDVGANVPAGAILESEKRAEEGVEAGAESASDMNGVSRAATAWGGTCPGAAARAYTASHKDRKPWIRIHARTHRLTGKPFRSVLLLVATPATDDLFKTNPDTFFGSLGGREALRQLDVLIRCKNSFNKEICELILTSKMLLDWLPPLYQVDLSSKFRRDRLGAFIMSYLSMQYDPLGNVALQLIRETALSSAIDQLIVEEEEKEGRKAKTDSGIQGI
jgi:hypothetical protein